MLNFKLTNFFTNCATTQMNISYVLLNYVYIYEILCKKKMKNM